MFIADTLGWNVFVVNLTANVDRSSYDLWSTNVGLASSPSVLTRKPLLQNMIDLTTFNKGTDPFVVAMYLFGMKCFQTRIARSQFVMKIVKHETEM
jgi:hypothetical protein